jgi:protein gp37
MGGDTAGPKLKWVIIGAETGNRKDRVIPKREWVMHIKRQCDEAGVCVWMKDSLRELMGEDFVQVKPWWNG